MMFSSIYIIFLMIQSRIISFTIIGMNQLITFNTFLFFYSGDTLVGVVIF